MNRYEKYLKCCKLIKKALEEYEFYLEESEKDFDNSSYFWGDICDTLNQISDLTNDKLVQNEDYVIEEITYLEFEELIWNYFDFDKFEIKAYKVIRQNQHTPIVCLNHSRYKF